MADGGNESQDKSSSIAGRGGAGAYLEGEIGAYYLLSMLAGGEARGLPGAALEKVQFQGEDAGFALDDIIIHGRIGGNPAILEIQSKRTITFSPKDEVFADVCAQVASAKPVEGVAPEKHLLAVAAHRDSARISGPYQEVLSWSRALASADAFFRRLGLKGAASLEMRDFVATFRGNLVASGVADDDEIIWAFLRRFQIIIFDFESSAAQARSFALEMAKRLLAPQEHGKAAALWASLIDLALKTAKVGGSIDAETLTADIMKLGFRLAGKPSFELPRTKLAEMARHALADIGDTIEGLNLPRQRIVNEIDDAGETAGFTIIHGGAGTGKSAVLKHVAERLMTESRAIILDPVRTPEGGWAALAHLLGVDGLASEFLLDLASSGGATIFIDSLDMFSDGGKRTVNDLIREASRIPGFRVIATSRPGFGTESPSWLDEAAVSALGQGRPVTVGELNDDEVGQLVAHTRGLKLLLGEGAAAAPVARNLYRLSRLLTMTGSAAIRTEAALAYHWWSSGDGAKAAIDVRAAQRIFEALADAAIAGEDIIKLGEDPPVRQHLLDTLSLREPRRDRLAFYHDVLRDWAVGMRLYEDLSVVSGFDLLRPAPPTLARGIEMAGRLALELNEDSAPWLALVGAFSVTGIHGSWRRNALMAILRSEIAGELLERHSALLLKDSGALLRELATDIVAVETMPTAEFFEGFEEAGIVTGKVPARMRSAASGAAWRLTDWCIAHAREISLEALGAIMNLVEIQIPLLVIAPKLGGRLAETLFDWLFQLDVDGQEMTIPYDMSDGPYRSYNHDRLISSVRTWALALGAAAPDRLKAYLKAIAEEDDDRKVKDIRPLSRLLSVVAPVEFAALIERSLVEHMGEDGLTGRRRRKSFGFADSDYLPPSPAQGPFLDLLDTNPEVGLRLIRSLLERAIGFHSGWQEASDGYRIEFDEGPRDFFFIDSYLWSRGLGNEYALASGLMALEAWGHERIEKGEPIDEVLADILGPGESPAAILHVAVDLLTSHWPISRDALVPFLASPELLTTERQRGTYDNVGSIGFDYRSEPAGRFSLARLKQYRGRGAPLEVYIPYYQLKPDAASDRLRQKLSAAVGRLGPYGKDDDFGEPAFMGAHALSQLDPANWRQLEDGGFQFEPPADIAAHLKRMQEGFAPIARASNIGARIQMAMSDPARGSAELARDAAEHFGGAIPDGNETDVLKMRSTQIVGAAMLVARDGDEKLLEGHEIWVRNVTDWAIREAVDEHGSTHQLEFSRPALAGLALIHLWRRKSCVEDRRAILAIAARRDGSGPLALEAGLEVILASDARLLKSAVRLVLKLQRWSHTPWDETEEEAEARAKARAARNAEAIAEEIVWLDGGAEPEWPELPEEETSDRRSMRRSRLTVEAVKERKRKAIERRSDEHANLGAIGSWLKLIRSLPKAPEWIESLVQAYAGWSARLNGYGLPSDADIGDRHSDWNDHYYGLAANVMMAGPDEQFEQMLALVEALPDDSFWDVAHTLLRAADVCYFNNACADPTRAIELRKRLGSKIRKIPRWAFHHRPASLSVDLQSGGLIGAFFLNDYEAFGGGTKSYLVTAVIERLDLLLDTLLALMGEGPTSFIALCTMNMLEVQVRARHTSFVLSSAEAWLARVPTGTGVWLELGIGRRLVAWLDAASSEDTGLFSPGHDLSARIDALLGRLVALGVPEAHELEKRILATRSKR